MVRVPPIARIAQIARRLKSSSIRRGGPGRLFSSLGSMQVKGTRAWLGLAGGAVPPLIVAYTHVQLQRGIGPSRAAGFVKLSPGGTRVSLSARGAGRWGGQVFPRLSAEGEKSY